MAAATLNDALAVFGKLSLEDQQMMLEIAEKRRIEAWRKEVAAYGRKAVRDCRAGKLKAIPRNGIGEYLEKLWEEDDA